MKKLTLIISTIFLFNCSSVGTIGGIMNIPEPVGTNYKIIGQVQGKADVPKILWINIGPNDLYNRAMANIKNQVDFYNGKKGLINVTVDYRYEFILVPLFGREIITITADLVEFIEGEKR